ncbi:MAG: YidC/Oxa1 family membrane protein insertase [Clostridiales bacterium]|nr:YidC/Oxa1 family membrane protein insertase [Clostridiales bacterium]
MGILSMEILNFTAPGTGSWLVQLISWLVKICSSVALGVILFTVILKLVTLPFDYVSRASMRKNSLKMEEMRPELEKLQEQYADNKELYNQKMMALYKKNGYSMFGACLPTILTLVIFIVAIKAFTEYSAIQNKTYFYNMSNSYNNVVYAGFELDSEERYIVRDKNGKIVIDYDAIVSADTNGDNKLNQLDNVNNNIVFNNDFEILYSQELDTYKSSPAEEYYNIKVWTSSGYVIYNQTFMLNTASQTKAIIEQSFSTSDELLLKTTLLTKENNFLKVNIDGQEKMYNDIVGTEDWTAEKFILNIRQDKSAETYRKEEQSFLWVKNIWVTDSPLSHPIESNWSTFKQTHGYHGADIGSDGYKNLIAKLGAEKNEPNGYFILVALTALSSLFMQLVMGKAQKAQMELQTVDGQGVQTQKIMKWMMPIMMAIFAFMYTAAFSLYIVVSSVFSILTTYGINFIVDRNFKKEQANKPTQKIRGRVYVPKQEVKKEEPKKKEQPKDDKFAHQSGGDFLTGKVKNKKKGK